MARSSRPSGIDISPSFSRSHIVLLLPWMCVGLVLGIEAWQKGFGFGLVVGVGGALLLGFVFFGLKLYNEAGSQPSSSLTRDSLPDTIGFEKREIGFEISPITWRNVNGTSVLRF